MRPKRIEPEQRPAAVIEGVRPFTAKQGQYLAFIYYYSKIHGTSPAESDLQRYFQVSPPVVHQMIKTLHAHGFIDRQPGKARSSREKIDGLDLLTGDGALAVLRERLSAHADLLQDRRNLPVTPWTSGAGAATARAWRLLPASAGAVREISLSAPERHE